MKTPLAILGNILSAWFIAPLVFLFLLGDTGEIKRGLLSAVPNPLFEPALRVLEDLDRALGSYMRGIFLECALLGLSVTVLLVIVGVAPRWAIVIGIFAGATNVVPFMGTAVALFGGLAYALLTEEMHPVLPMVNAGNFVFWVVAAVAAAEVLKNIFFEPVVLGGAVKLHPLVVVIGIVGGGILFDLAGVLLAIPAITIFKVSISSTARQLKAYGLVVDQLLAEPVMGYSVTYPMGVMGGVLAISLVQKLWKVNYADEAQNLNIPGAAREALRRATIRVSWDGAERKTITELSQREKWDVVFGRVKRGDSFLLPGPRGRLRLGDLVAVVGTESELERVAAVLGERC